MGKSHYLIKQNGDSNPEQHLLKQWFRDHRNIHGIMSEHVSDSATSHRMRNSLSRLGWQIVETENDVFVIQPDQNDSFEYADKILSEYETEGLINEETEIDDALSTAFGLEKDMQHSLRTNLESLEPGLEPIDNGKEITTEAGRIDILAKDSDEKYVVIELKASQARPEVIAQTLAYMTAIQNEKKVEVRGIIVAHDFHPKVKLAVKQLPNLKLVHYNIQFSFNEVM